MATSGDYIKFVCGQIDGAYAVRYKKAFGEYIVYLNDKPVLLVCDNRAYVKKADELQALLSAAEVGVPYDGAKEHYLLDMENTRLVNAVVRILEEITPLPKPQRKRK